METIVYIPSMKYEGEDLKRKQDLLELTPTEVAAKAGVSTGTLRRVHRNEAPETTRMLVSEALETLRLEKLRKLQEAG